MRTTLGLITLALVGVAGCSVSTAPGSITFKSQTRFTSPDITKTSAKDWSGEAIEINDDGTSVSVNGGLRVIGDPTAKRITITARVIAYADADDEANAKLSIAEAQQTLTITEEAQKITVRCGHGQTHGSSKPDKSGCELLTVTIPSGDATTPLNLTVGCGNGDITLSRVTGQILVEENGTGSINASVNPAKGKPIQITGKQGNDVTVALPADFAADQVVLSAEPASKISNAFSDVQSGSGRGTQGTGASKITITSTPFAGSSGTVSLTKQ